MAIKEDKNLRTAPFNADLVRYPPKQEDSAPKYTFQHFYFTLH